ncbi:hypothetical protein [Acetobacter malorum]|uniref:hypothetical protein n=1 Tax=Acetobacter malorum TaxID=178901 RepID=UPI0039E79180
MNKEKKEALDFLEDACKEAREEILNATEEDELCLSLAFSLTGPNKIVRASGLLHGKIGNQLNLADQLLIQLVLNTPDEDRDSILFRRFVYISETVRRHRAGDRTPVTRADLEKAQTLIMFRPA